MKIKLSIFLILSLLLFTACNQSPTQTSKSDNNVTRSSGGKTESPLEKPSENSSLETAEDQNSKINASSQTNEPKTVKDFFTLLPEKYFTLEGCFREKDKDCSKARAEYLKNYKEIEDIKNGYLKAGCDGAQSCIEMALFKRPDNSYVIAVATFSEELEEIVFLDYKNGVWTDVSQKIVPEFSKDKRYEIPRYGTTVKVFSTKLIEKGDDYEVREKDKNIYDLEWKDGKFLKAKGKR